MEQRQVASANAYDGRIEQERLVAEVANQVEMERLEWE